MELIYHVTKIAPAPKNRIGEISKIGIEDYMKSVSH